MDVEREPFPPGDLTVFVIKNYGGDPDSLLNGHLATLCGYDFSLDMFIVETDTNQTLICGRNELVCDNQLRATIWLDSFKEAFSPTNDVQCTHDILLLVGKDIPYSVITSWSQETRNKIEKWAASCVAQANDHAGVVVPPTPPEVKDY